MDQGAVLKLLIDASATASPAAIFATMWWLERKERQESHRQLEDLSHKIMGLTHVLQNLKEWIK